MSIVQTHKKTADVQARFLDDVKDWDQLKIIDSFFVKFRKISPNEALSNAIELKDLVKKLKDTVKPAFFDIPSLNARINILNNEALRLADLVTISAIKAAEVNEQVDKTMNAFSSLNLKINTLLAKKRFEDEITIDVDFIGLDTTKIDSISKKSIDVKLKENLLKNRDLDRGSNKRQ